MAVQGRTHFAKNLDIDVLVDYVKGKKNYLRMLKHFLLRARCFFVGHEMTRDIWKNNTNENWYEDKDFEYHVGCKNCSLFFTEKPVKPLRTHLRGL